MARKSKEFADDLISGMEQAEDDLDAAQPDPEPEPVEETPEVPEPVVSENEEHAPPPTTDKSQPEWLERLQEFGFQNVQNEDEGRERLVEAYQQQQEQLEALRREQEQYRYFAQQQQKPEPEPEPEASTSAEPWWNPPAFNASLAEKYWVPTGERHEDGEARYDWAPNTPMAIREAADSYRSYLDTWRDNIANRPHEVLPQIIQSEFQSALDGGAPLAEAVQRLVDSRVQDILHQRDEQTYLQSQIEAHQDELYQIDPVTNAPRRDHNGQLVLSERGRLIEEMMDRGEQMGIRSDKDLWEYATAMANSHMPKSNTEARASKRRQHVQRAATAAGAPNYSSQPTSDIPSEKPARWQDTLLEEIESNGVLN